MSAKLRHASHYILIYFQYCIEGQCVPYYPDDEGETNNNNDGTINVDNDIAGDKPGEDDDAIFFPNQIPEKENSADENTKNDDGEPIQRDRSRNSIPVWYYPIFTKVFNDLKTK